MEELESLQYSPKKKGLMPVQGFIVLILVLVILIAGMLFMRSSYFAVGEVIVEGNRYITAEDVYRIAEIPERVNIFNLNTSDIRGRLLKDLRIAQVDVSRHFPGTIVIHITERKPVTYVASSYGFLELDAQGTVLAAFKNLKNMNVPIITGVRLDNEYVSDQIENPTIRGIVNYLSQLDELALNQISEIHIRSPEQVIAYTVTAVEIRLGTSEKLSDKVKSTNIVLHEIHDKKMNVEYIDLTYASPYIKLKS